MEKQYKIQKDGRARVRVRLAKGVYKVVAARPEALESAIQRAKGAYQETSTHLSEGSPLDMVAAQLWIPRIERKQPTTYSRYRAAWSHIHAYMGGTPVQNITPIMVQRFVHHLEQKQVSRTGKGKVTAPMSPAGVRFVYSTLHQVLELAYLAQLINRNPCNKLVDKPAPPKKRDRKMSVETAWGYVENAPEDLRLAMFCGLVLGLRLGEISGLMWGDIDRQALTLHIQRQRDAKGQIRDLKTDGSNRVLELTRFMVDQLDRFGNLDSEYVSPLSYRSIQNRYRDWAEKPTEWTFHDSRHGAVHNFLAVTHGNIMAAMDTAGHTKVETTMSYTSADSTRTKSVFQGLTTRIDNRK